MQSIRSTFIAITLVVLIAAPTGPAMARAFAGASIGYSEYQDMASSSDAVPGNVITPGSVGAVTSSRHTQNKNGLGLRLFAGDWFTERLGFEVGYVDLGKSTETITANGTLGSAIWNGKLGITAIYAALDLCAGNRTVGETVWISRLGAYAARARADASVSTSGTPIGRTFTTGSTGAYFGTGFERRITSNLSVHLQFDSFFNVHSRFNGFNGAFTSGTTAALISLGLAETF